MSENTVNVEISDEALASIAGYSALAGLTPLIPIPFVDDVVMVRIHRRLCAVLFGLRDMELSDAGAKALTESPSKFLSSTFKKLVFWPIKKLITKIVYVLAIKSCADIAAAVFHEGWLLARALEQEYVPSDLLRSGDPATMKRLRVAIISAREAVDPSPTQAAMRSAFGVGKEVFSSILSSVRGVLKRGGGDEDRLNAAEHEVAPIANRIQDEIAKHWSSGPLLDAELRKALDLGSSKAS